MTEEPLRTTLQDRPAAYSVMHACLTEQGTATPITRTARVFGISPVTKTAEPWFQGALGELQVARELERLGPEWTVLHSIPIGDGESDIDHVLIGPAGVFTINTKHHARGKVWLSSKMLMVNGQKTDHLRNCRHEAKRAAAKLTLAMRTQVDVTPIIALVGTAQLTVRSEPSDVEVIRLAYLIRNLKQMRPRLSPARLAAIAAAAVAPSTWRSATYEHPQRHVIGGFERLKVQDESARRTRKIWLVGIVTAIAVGLFAVVRVMAGTAFANYGVSAELSDQLGVVIAVVVVVAVLQRALPKWR